MKNCEFPFQIPALEESEEPDWNCLTIAIPKSPRLEQGTINWLAGKGFQFPSSFTEGRTMVYKGNERRKVMKLRGGDIIRFLTEGNIPLGILGADEILEAQLAGIALQPIKRLGFGECMFRLAFPIEGFIPQTFKEIKGVLENGIIATGLPNTLMFLMKRQEIMIEPKQLFILAGSVEIAQELNPDVAAMADIVSTGKTAVANGIRPDFCLIQFPGAFLVKKAGDENIVL